MIDLPPGVLGRAIQNLRRGDVLLRLGLCLLAAVVMWAVTAAWEPHLSYREGFAPPRDVVARVAFHELDDQPQLEESAPTHRKAKVVEEGQVLAKAGQPIDRKSLDRLRSEHDAFVAQLTVRQRVYHSLAAFGMYVAMYTLCGFYIYYRQPRLLASLRQFATLLGLVVVTVVLCRVAVGQKWPVEAIPLLLLAMTAVIAYRHELALLLSAVVSLVVAIAFGLGLTEFVILGAAAATAVMLSGRIRSRTTLCYVGLLVGLVAMLTTVGVGTLAGQPMMPSLLSKAGAIAFLALLAGLLMTGLLPFIERLFDVQTEIRLLELGDAAHPLLQELVRRAPGTYNHSINVASIGESAAEGIDANGLLVRVGAYFHDIGKMLKPGYFVENQGQEANCHESLVPAMSTLVIIAHVKDGADLARQHHLPQTMIDFIQQHHGTTLVQYFYDQANKRNQSDPNAGSVDETTFRYPGPKPQTKEAGVLLLADAVESASRTLVEPAPARIEGLVKDIMMQRLLDGQFDECGLTLRELNIVEESLVKSLTAVYHGRVTYPDQHTA